MDWFKPKPTEEEKKRFTVLHEKFNGLNKAPHQMVVGNRGNARLVNKPDYNEYLVLEKKFRGGKTRKRKRRISTRYKKI